MPINGLLRTCLAAALVFTGLPLAALAAETTPQEPSRTGSGPAVEDAEVVIVVGPRRRFQLRLALQDAEQAVYDVFNRFNDEPRFHITCARQLRYASRIEREDLNCMPEFELQAQRAEAQDTLEAFRNVQSAGLLTGLQQDAVGAPTNGQTPAPVIMPYTQAPAAAMVAAQQEAYRRKMREVAEANPEFREALIKYVELKNIYLDVGGRPRE